jgi:hypothetical protein
VCWAKFYLYQNLIGTLAVLNRCLFFEALNVFSLVLFLYPFLGRLVFDIALYMADENRFGVVFSLLAASLFVALLM